MVDLANHLHFELGINTLKVLQEALESKYTKSKIQTPRRRPNVVHTQLWNATVNRPDTRCCTQHRSYCTSTPTVITNLEDLELRILFADPNIFSDTAVQDGCRDKVGSHVAIGIGRDGGADVEAERMVFEIRIRQSIIRYEPVRRVCRAYNLKRRCHGCYYHRIQRVLVCKRRTRIEGQKVAHSRSHLMYIR